MKTVNRRRPSKAAVIGSGPNGLTAALILAGAGLPTTVFEGAHTIGGGARSAELTLPGFLHDICSAIHPFALGSPAFAMFPLAEHGLDWIQPPLALAHPMDDGSAAALDHSLERTVELLGRDGAVYRRLIGPLAERWPELAIEILRPLAHVPRNPFVLARFGALAGWPATVAAHTLFRTARARALLAGNAAHSVIPLDHFGSGAFGWVLLIAAHACGWPIPRGGAQKVSDALASVLALRGGRIQVGHPVRTLAEFDPDTLVLCDVTPRQFLSLAADRLPANFRDQLTAYRYGPGVFKMDWALNAPIPWTAPECRQAGTVHVGGTLGQIASSERDAWEGRLSEEPFVLVAQSSLFDPSRAPKGKHTAWAYCHVPSGSDADMTERIERQIERFAPGFRDCILQRHRLSPSQLEAHNPNLVGGDVTGGAHTMRQLLFRPTPMLYRTPLDNVYLCSSSTPPGGGVHGMCGFMAARTALQDAGIRPLLPA